jgi:MFS family permease
MSARNLSILLICQLISATGAIVLVTLGGIIGSELSGNRALATLPVSVMVISVAATTVPATLLMRAIGRKSGSSLASLSAALAALFAAYAISITSFPLFIAAAAIFGINMAFTQQYRYAAVESVEQHHASRAISIVLLGAIGGAFAGAELVKHGHGWLDNVPYAGTLIAVAVMYVVQSLLFQLLGPLRGEEHGSTTQSHRPLGQVVRQPVYIVAVLGATVAYGVMTLIMTATPLSMHVNDGYSLEATANVIRAHVLGMYLPSLVSGFLIDRLGTVKMMSVGAFTLLVAAIIGLRGQSIMHYWFTLVLLGVGWNFLYVGGTTMLTLTYSMAERFKAQAVNEFSVFGTSATASLLAGTVIYYYGWNTLIFLAIPLLLMIVAGLFIVRRDPMVRV